MAMGHVQWQKNEMFCQTCQKFPDIGDKNSPLVNGTSNYCIDSLRLHDRLSNHKQCMEWERWQAKPLSKQELLGTPISTGILKLNNE